MTAKIKSLFIIVAVGVLLVANAVTAMGHLGSQIGQTFRWIDRETGAVLVYTPSVYGSARFELPPPAHRSAVHWELVKPEPPSPWLPWNWLAVTLSPQPPDPNAVVRMIAGR